MALRSGYFKFFKMKKSLLLFFATTILTSSNVFTQTVLDWTTTAGVKMHDVQWTNSGEIFAVGEFRGTTNFGGITLTANPWNGGTNNDGVLLRLDTVSYTHLRAHETS